MNQAYDRLYSDKVSKFAIFGPISNFARSLQATPLNTYIALILRAYVSIQNNCKLIVGF